LQLSTEYQMAHTDENAAASVMTTIARDWELLVWAVEDEEKEAAVECLHSLKGALDVAVRAVMASYCHSLEQHLVQRGFEGLTPVLYEFHLRIQSMLDERRLADG
jgi:hypothetical protein